MRCQNNFCVYWQNNECILEEISLDSQGQCEDILYVEIEEEILNQKRKEIIERIARY